MRRVLNLKSRIFNRRARGGRRENKGGRVLPILSITSQTVICGNSKEKSRDRRMDISHCAQLGWRIKASLVCLFLLGLASTPVVDAREINKDLMDRDLRIMEGVLADILDDDDGPAIWGRQGTRVQGTYYDGYGVLFLVEGSGSPHRVHIRTKDGHHKFDFHLENGDADSEVPSDPLEDRKARIVDFFGNYAGTIRQLGPNEKISVRLHPGRGGNHTRGFMHAKLPGKMRSAMVGPSLMRKRVSELDSAKVDLDEIRVELDRAKADLSKKMEDLHVKKFGFGGEPHPGLVASVLKKDVDAHQGTDKLAEAVQFREIDKDSYTTPDIRIFSGILETALEIDRWQNGSRGTTGFYEEGVGCLFFVERDLSKPFVWVPYPDHPTREMSDTKAAYSFLRVMLAQTIADYGATLNRMKKDEHIVVNVRLRGTTRDEEIPTRIVVRASKDHVDRYNDGKMRLQDFHKNIDWQEL